MTVDAYSKQFKRLVAVEIPAGDIEDFVDTDADWVVSFREWAQRMPLSGEEQIVAQQIHPRASHRIRMRWNGDVDTTRVRFRIDNKVYYVVSEKDLEDRNRFYEFVVREDKA